MAEPEDRCKLIILANPSITSPDLLVQAVSGGLVASCILYRGSAEEAEFAEFCENSVSVLQDQGVAVLIADDSRLFGRVGADGLFLEKTRNDLSDIMQKFSPGHIIGCGGFRNRHSAMQIGEMRPDFVMFGKLGGDIREEAHPKNLALAQWWSEIIEIPSVILAGTHLESIIECAKTGADFVAVEAYVFNHSAGPAAAVQEADSQLEIHAPRFEGEPA